MVCILLAQPNLVPLLAALGVTMVGSAPGHF